MIFGCLDGSITQWSKGAGWATYEGNVPKKGEEA